MIAYGFVGNLGCIRFPQPVRKAAGIKRGDRLLVLVQDDGTVVLEKLDVPEGIEVSGCACEDPPEACQRAEPGLVTVGWSYVQLERGVAESLGLLPNVPIKLVAEPSQITVAVHDDAADLEGVEPLACPP